MKSQTYPADLAARAELLKAFAHPVRLCIIKRLLQTESINVSKMESCLSVSQSSISQHLIKMRHAGIIQSERVKNEVHYSLKNEEIKEFAKSILGGLTND